MLMCGCVDVCWWLCWCVLMIVLMCWCADDCVDDCVKVLVCWWFDNFVEVLMTVLMTLCVDVLMCWCVDVWLMCGWCVVDVSPVSEHRCWSSSRKNGVHKTFDPKSRHEKYLKTFSFEHLNRIFVWGFHNKLLLEFHKFQNPFGFSYSIRDTRSLFANCCGFSHCFSILNKKHSPRSVFRCNTSQSSIHQHIDTSTHQHIPTRKNKRIHGSKHLLFYHGSKSTVWLENRCSPKNNLAIETSVSFSKKKIFPKGRDSSLQKKEIKKTRRHFQGLLGVTRIGACEILRFW